MAPLIHWSPPSLPTVPRASHKSQRLGPGVLPVRRTLVIPAASSLKGSACDAHLPPAVLALTSQHGSRIELQLSQGHHGYIGRNDTIFWLDEDLCLAVRTRGSACSFSMNIDFSAAGGPCDIQQWQEHWREQKTRLQPLSDALVVAAAQAAPSKKSGAMRRVLKQYRNPLAVVTKQKQVQPSSRLAAFTGSFCGVHVRIHNSQHRGTVAARFLRAATAEELPTVEQFVGYKLRWPLYGTNSCSWCGAVCLSDWSG